jgi:hypothetical protein
MEDDQFSFYLNTSSSDKKIQNLEINVKQLLDTQQLIINKFNKFVESYNILCDLNEKANIEIENLKTEIKDLKSHKRRKINKN